LDVPKTSRVDLSIVSREVYFPRQQAKTNIKRYIDERLPEEYEKCMVGLTAILREAWNTATNTEDKKEKIQALSLAKECYSMKLDLLTTATLVDDVIRFVAEKSRDKATMSKTNSNEHDKEESTESDYDEDEEAEEITTSILMLVFHLISCWNLFSRYALRIICVRFSINQLSILD
jgi:hypothetical protein